MMLKKDGKALSENSELEELSLDDMGQVAGDFGGGGGGRFLTSSDDPGRDPQRPGEKFPF